MASTTKKKATKKKATKKKATKKKATGTGPRMLKTEAIRIVQNPSHPIYLFALTAEQIHQIADISRVSRDDAGQLIGYQRDEVRRHVKEIIEYIDDDQDEAFLFPNSLILSLSSDVKFSLSRGPKVAECSAQRGVLEIPIPREGEPKPGFIVDGQQRALAMGKAKRSFLCPVNAFVADTVNLQRDQFMRVNNSRPLPRGLITELLPEVTTTLPAKLAASKIPSEICNMLNREESSPFHGLIRRSSTTKVGKRIAVVQDTSIVKMVQESLTTPSGCLFPYRNLATGKTDFDGLWNVLLTYWTAVRNVFPEAWGKKPKHSRLMHGVGIRSMGRVMDRVMSSVPPGANEETIGLVEEQLRRLAPHCNWTSGYWDEIGEGWNELQNTPKDIRKLSSLLIRYHFQSRQFASVSAQ